MKNLLVRLLLISVSLFHIQSLNAQSLNKESITRFCDSIFNKGINDTLIPGAIITVLKNDTILISKGYGYANLDSKSKVDTGRTFFQFGSIGKIVTAIAVLQQVEIGRLNLDTDVNEYLKDFKINNYSKKPITLFHLLTHTAGLDDRVIGYTARSQREVKSLATHLKERMPAVFQEPGSEINYSNYGYSLAGYLVELAADQEFSAYIKQHIFDPLGMAQTTYLLPDGYSERDDFAIGYQLKEDFSKVVAYPRHTLPAGSIVSTNDDMKRLLQALVRRDTGLLKSASFDRMFTLQHSDHLLLNGYSIGFETQRINGHDAIAKGGSITGFLSELVLVPQRGFGMLVSVNTQTDDFLEQFSKSFFSRFFPGTMTQAKKINISLAPYVGNFRSNRYNHHTMEDLPAMYLGKFVLWQNENGELECFHNGDYQQYLPVDSLTFQNTKDASQYLIYKKDHKGNIKSLHRNENIAGFTVPISYIKIPWYDNPDFINEQFPIVFIVISVYLFFPFFWSWVWIKRRKKPDFWQGKFLSRRAHGVGLSITLLIVIYLIAFLIPFFKNLGELFFGLPDSIKPFLYVPLLITMLFLWLCIELVRIWKMKLGILLARIYYTLFCCSCLLVLIFFWRWHFLLPSY